MGNYTTAMICDNCGSSYSMRDPLTTCPKCGGLLEIIYDLARMKAEIHSIAGNPLEHSIWRYQQFFPAVSPQNIVSLGEGCSPLIKSVHLAKELGMESLYFKNDTMMPTGSFKDRGFSLAVSYAKEIGIKRGFTYSSGNAGSSLAAYASRSGFDALVCVEYLASKTKKAIIQLYGANTAVLHFNHFSEISTMLELAVSRLGLYQFVNFINPIRHEAMKTYAYEITEKLGHAPNAMFHPVGTGGGIWGAWKGYCELKELGFTEHLPKMYGVQPSDCAHFKEAFDKGGHLADTYGDCTKTIAQSIASDSPLQGGRRVLKAVYDSGGAALAVDDAEILEAMRDLAREGIAAEPSSAAAVAALKQARRNGLIQADEETVCVITGSALKQPAAVELAAGEPVFSLQADIDNLTRLIRQIGL